MPTVNGIYSLPPGSLVTEGETILPSQHNPPLQDIAENLTSRMMRDGSSPMTGDLTMGNNRISNLKAAEQPHQVPRLDQVISKAGGTVTGQLLLSGARYDALVFDRGSKWSIGLFDGSALIFTKDGTTVARIHAEGAAAPFPTSLMSREMADARYGLPASITADSGNTVSGGTHTHSISGLAVRQLIAQGPVGSVGKTAFLKNNGPDRAFGENTAGSNLVASNVAGTGGTVMAGTWACCGSGPNGSITLWERVS